MTHVSIELEKDSKILARQAAPRYSQLAALAAAVLLLAGLALGVRPAAAQGPVSLETLLISLWPEFDRAAVLVILDGTLPTGTTLPAQVALHMPAAAGQPSATAYTAADGTLLAAPFTTTPAGDDIIVTLTTETLKFRLEYYDPALSQTGSQRAYTFAWTSATAVTAAVVRLQQPAGAGAPTTTPALTSVGAGDYGLQYYEGDLGTLTAGQRVQLAVGYTKTDDTLSSVAVGAGAPAATADSGTGAASPAAGNTTAIWLAVGGVVVLGAGVLGFILMQRRAATSARSRRAPRRHRPGTPVSTQRGPAPARLSTERFTAAERQGFIDRQAAARTEAAQPADKPAAGTAFCTQCGQKLRPGDKFCRQCGTPVRAVSNN